MVRIGEISALNDPLSSKNAAPASREWNEIDPKVDALVNEVMGQVADKWTLLVLEELEEGGEQRFTVLHRRVPGISQKMLTQTLRQMERTGLVVRTVHPVVPPRVDYRLTDLGRELGEAFCGVWRWAERNRGRIEACRKKFDEKR